MSGICGIALRRSSHIDNETVLMPMVRALRFLESGRGETATFETTGFGVSPCVGYDSGIARHRLNGHSVALAIHGRLYNAGELQASEGRDATLPASLLDLYVHEGMKFLERLRGEFALAIWDGREGALFLITDRFRVEPLFYLEDGEKLVFASRTKSILANPMLIDRSLDLVSVVDVMAFSSVCTPRTIFQKIKKIPPGSVLKYRDGVVSVGSYWDINFRKPSKAREEELATTLKFMMEDAVSARLQSDQASCRIGAFLSGGVDSSTVTGLLTKLTKGPVKSFTIGFGEERFNEMEFARIAARHYKSEHHEYFVTPDDVSEAITVMMEAFDEPFANASAVPTYFCAKLAKENDRDVLYAGDGGDEIFGGNERYGDQRIFEYYAMFPKWLRDRFIEPTVGLLADHVGGRVFISGKKYIRRANIPYPQRLTSYGVFNVIPMGDLMSAGVLDAVGRQYDPYSPINMLYHEAQATAELDRQLYVDLKHAIADSDLFKVTRMAHAAGVTVRFPFLDHRLAEFAASVPADVKMRGTELRSFFKKAYADFLPESTRTKSKHGFGLPIPVWLRTNSRLNDMMHDLVLSPKSVQRGFFQKKMLEHMLDAHRQDTTSFYGTLLWNVMVLELWCRSHLDRAPLTT